MAARAIPVEDWLNEVNFRARALAPSAHQSIYVWLCQQRAAYDTGDWKEFARLARLIAIGFKLQQLGQGQR